MWLNTLIFLSVEQCFEVKGNAFIFQPFNIHQVTSKQSKVRSSFRVGFLFNHMLKGSFSETRHYLSVKDRYIAFTLQSICHKPYYMGNPNR